MAPELAAARALTYLQIVGGSFFLLQKACRSLAERSSGEQKWWSKIGSWVFYSMGLPCIVVLFFISGEKGDWIAGCLEAGGLPSMLLGLYITIQRDDRKLPLWTIWTAAMAGAIGVGVSIYYYRHITAVDQRLEMGLTVAYLVGTFLLASERETGWWVASGYLCYVVMHICAGWLFFRQHESIMVYMQAASLFLVADAFIMNRRQAGLRAAAAG